MNMQFKLKIKQKQIKMIHQVVGRIKKKKKKKNKVKLMQQKKVTKENKTQKRAKVMLRMK